MEQNMFCYARCYFRKYAEGVQTSQKHSRFFWYSTLLKNTIHFLVTLPFFVAISSVYVSDWKTLVAWIMPMKMWKCWYHVI